MSFGLSGVGSRDELDLSVMVKIERAERGRGRDEVIGSGLSIWVSGLGLVEWVLKR